MEKLILSSFPDITVPVKKMHQRLVGLKITATK
jgi:hypothetical protein